MVDYDLYNERRQQLIDVYGDCPFDFVYDAGISIVDILDNVEWEDNGEIASLMGWVVEDEAS